jgi:hypothetical protein
LRGSSARSRRSASCSSTRRARAFPQPLAGPGRTIITSTKTGEKTAGVAHFSEAFADASADTDRNGRISIAEAFGAKSKAAATYTKGARSSPSTRHSTTAAKAGSPRCSISLGSRPHGEDREGREPRAARVAEQQQALQTQIDGLKLKKDIMPTAEYDPQMEKLLTDLALKARAIREIEAKK